VKRHVEEDGERCVCVCVCGCVDVYIKKDQGELLRGRAVAQRPLASAPFSPGLFSTRAATEAPESGAELRQRRTHGHCARERERERRERERERKPDDVPFAFRSFLSFILSLFLFSRGFAQTEATCAMFLLGLRRTAQRR